jgi:glycosyltransferase involved in cell wall biosynthesis
MGLKNVIFTGRRSKEEVPRYLSISDACLVHLRKTDLFRTVLPSKIFEATGMAKPIIIGVPGSAEELVMAAHAGIAIEPDNARDLADAVVQLADHPDLQAEYGNAGREYVVKNYNRDFLAQDYLKVLDQVGPAALKEKKTTAEQLKWTQT